MMRPYWFGDMTWEEVRDLDVSVTLAVLPVGAMEAHGPHLPLSTDNHIAEAMAKAGAEKLARHGFRCLVLPCLPYTAAPFASEFPGTLSVRPETVTTIVADVAQSLGHQGIQCLAIANVHLDPTHLDALDAAVKASRSGSKCSIVFPNIATKPWAHRLTEEFQSGACHAGQYESSVIMATCPELVRDEIRRSLTPNPVSLSRAIRDGKRTFREAGGPRAYFGDPAQASMEEGRQVIEILGDILADAVLSERNAGPPA